MFTYYQPHPDPKAPITAPPLEGDFRASMSPTKEEIKLTEAVIAVAKKEEQSAHITVNPAPPPQQVPTNPQPQSPPPIVPKNFNNQTISIPQPAIHTQEQERA